MMIDFGPTPKREWVREGDRCISAAGWTGLVLKVVPTHSLPYARVRWDRNGHEGAVTITTVRKADGTLAQRGQTSSRGFTL